jgi:hypothetical protein
VLNQLLKHTALQGRFSANMVALVGSQPRTLTLKDFLQHWLDFRRGAAAGCHLPASLASLGVSPHVLGLGQWEEAA